MREKSNSFEIQRIGRSTSFKVLRSGRNSTQLPTKPPLQIFQAGCMQRRTEPPLQIFQAACAATCKSCPTINGSPGPSPGRPFLSLRETLGRRGVLLGPDTLEVLCNLGLVLILRHAKRVTVALILAIQRGLILD